MFSVLPSTCLSIIGFFVVLSAGCGGSGIERVTVSGNVTYRGQPVPSGIISFTPDAKKGNRGPQGIAKIVDGHYTTDDHGKGSVHGPQLVEIRGFGGGGGSSRGDSLPFTSGRPLFPTFYTEAEVKEGDTSLDFVVPEGSTSAPPGK